MTYTRTYATMEVTSPTYEEVRTKMLAAGYKEQVKDGDMLLDMHGVALIPSDTAPPQRGPSIADLQAQIWEWTKDKGWADDRGFSDLLLLMVTEIAEAVEEYRDWYEPNETRVVNGKPEGIPIELADVVIRILSFCSRYDVNLQNAILQKMAYNETREHRHGGKRI